MESGMGQLLCPRLGEGQAEMTKMKVWTGTVPQGGRERFHSSEL